MSAKSKINTQLVPTDELSDFLSHLAEQRAQVSMYYISPQEEEWSISWRLPELDIEDQPVVEFPDDEPPKEYA